MNVACLRPSDFTAPDGETYTQVLEEITAAYGVDLSFHDFQPHHGEIPEPEESYDAIVITGSGAHVYDAADQDWVEPTEQYIQQALDEGTPVLGICYGHQILADTLGGEVERMPEREMGYNTIVRTAESQDHPLFDGIPEEFTTFTSHQDYVPELPESAVQLAQNEYGNHAYAVEDEDMAAYGVQFHPEYDLGMALKLLDSKQLETDEEDEIFDTYTGENIIAAKTATQVIENFFTQLVADSLMAAPN